MTGPARTMRKPATSCRHSAFSVGMNIVASDLTHGGSVFDNLLLESSGDDEESIPCRNLMRRMIELGVLAHRWRRHQPAYGHKRIISNLHSSHLPVNDLPADTTLRTPRSSNSKRTSGHLKVEILNGPPDTWKSKF